MSRRNDRHGVLCVGRVYCDLVFTDVPRLPSLGTEIFAGGLSLHPGGGAAITAAYLSALGRPAFLGATLPAAPFGTLVAGALADLQIDTRFSTDADAGVDPQLTVAMANAGDRAFLTRDDGPVAPTFEAESLRAAGIGHLHIGELKSLVERPDLLSLAREADLTVSLDCGWEDRTADGVADLIAEVDVFLPNQEEVAHLTELNITPRPKHITVIKRGENGATVARAGQDYAMAAHPAKVIDTTGAGDAFNGGFLDVWLRDDTDLSACLAQGVACGALAVSSPGGTQGAQAVRSGKLRTTTAAK